jgi:uncharacterized protein YndB with AHSA1/START domain
MQDTISLTLKYTLPAAPPMVYAAITQPEHIQAWSGQPAVMELEKDGYVELFDGWVRGEIIALKPDQEIAFTWRPDEWQLQWEDSEVLIVLKPTPNGKETELTLIHDNLPTQKEMESHHDGWFKMYLDPLKEYLATL